jgi:hypothetical protein
MAEKERFDRIFRFHEWMLKIGNIYMHSNPLMEKAYNRVE